MTHPINCTLHDYLEVACLYRYQLEITLADGRVVAGKARTTTASNGQEFLVIESDGRDESLNLAGVVRVVAKTDGAMFDVLDFESRAD